MSKHLLSQQSPAAKQLVKAELEERLTLLGIVLNEIYPDTPEGNASRNHRLAEAAAQMVAAGFGFAVEEARIADAVAQANAKKAEAQGQQQLPEGQAPAQQQQQQAAPAQQRAFGRGFR